MARWNLPHELNIDIDEQEKQWSQLSKFKDDLFLCYTVQLHPMARVEYRDYYITDGVTVFRFGPVVPLADSDEGTHIVPDTYTNTSTQRKFKKTDDVVNRMRKVCGARNHSIMLRNCEHVAKYIQSGSWLSSGATPGGWWGQVFQAHLTENANFLATQDPDELTEKHVMRTVFKGKPCFLNYKRTKKAITQRDADTAYNVVVIGPTGCGKSNLINLMYNKTVRVSKESVDSIDRGVSITQGICNGSLFGYKNYPVNICDCMGFCDSELSGAEVFDKIQHTIEAAMVRVHRVVIVCSGRLEKPQEEQIGRMVTWLKVKEHPFNFILVYTKCDKMTEAERETALNKIMSRLGLSPCTTKRNKFPTSSTHGEPADGVNVISHQHAVAFPPDAEYDQAVEDLRRVIDAIFDMQRDDEAIPLKRSDGCSIL